MVELRHANHCVYKYRKKLLFENEKVEILKQVCSEIGKRYWFEFDAIGSDGFFDVLI